MLKLDEKEMKKINAGALSGTLLNALIKGVSTFNDLGRYVGSSIRRFVSNNLCRF